MPRVRGDDDGGGYGVNGNSSRGGYGVIGQRDSSAGVYGYSIKGRGVVGWSDDDIGVRGVSGTGAATTPGVVGTIGVVGEGADMGVNGISTRGAGVFAQSASGTGIYAYSYTGHAAYLDGRVYIRGPVEKPGGSFKIDHPLDPANKYLSHSFVESSDMKNIYDGVVALDEKGEAEVVLPDWFGALNKDFRYQLTAIGAPGPNLYISQELSDEVPTDSNNTSSYSSNRFNISGGTLGMKVSWSVTGIRKAPWANAHRIQVEEDKTDKERGHYLYPELYGQPEEMQIAPFTFHGNYLEKKRKRRT
jgi:hypothetical protein